MDIEIIHKKINSLTLTEHDTEKEKQLKIKVVIGNQVFENLKDKFVFRIRYDVEAFAEGRATLNFKYDFDYKSKVEVNEELSNSLVMRSQAPFLAFPYIKNYIESLIQSSGLGTVNIPYFDFIESPMEIDKN